MKVYPILLIVLLGNLLSAQENFKLTYQLTYALDSLNRESKKSEMFLLYTQKDKSIFRSLNGFKRDSLSDAIHKQFTNGTLTSIDLRGTKNTAFPYTIIKTADTNEMYQRIGNSNFYYIENKITSWKPTTAPEKFSFDNVECKTAQISFSGREYIAWYREDIPIYDGPYIFSGLPGLIVKIQDTKKDYVFELKEIQKIDAPQNLPTNTANAKKIAKSKFYHSIENHKESMINNIKAMGIDIPPQKEKEIRDRRSRENNPLELKP